MAGRNAGRPRKSRGKSAGVAAILLSFLIIVYLLGGGPTPGTADVTLPIPPPPEFWVVFALVLAQVIVAYLYVRERGRLRHALGARSLEIEEPEPELRPHGPIIEEVPESVEVAYEEAPDPGLVVPVAEAKRDGEFSKLLQWLDDVSTQISGWASDVMQSVDSAVHRKEAPPSTPLVLEDATPRGTSKIPIPKLGTWTEVRARTAIEKYLRKRPWAPSSDIAKELGMEISLASRLTATLREESVR